jgi:hypothetical protein
LREKQPIDKVVNRLRRDDSRLIGSAGPDRPRTARLTAAALTALEASGTVRGNDPTMRRPPQKA